MNLKTFLSDYVAIAIIFAAQLLIITVILIAAKVDRDSGVGFAMMASFALTFITFYLIRGKFIISWSLAQALLNLGMTSLEVLGARSVYAKTILMDMEYGHLIFAGVIPLMVILNKYLFDYIAGRMNAARRNIN